MSPSEWQTEERAANSVCAENKMIIPRFIIFCYYRLFCGPLTMPAMTTLLVAMKIKKSSHFTEGDSLGYES